MLLLHIKKLLVKILNRLKDMGTLLWIIREFLSCLSRIVLSKSFFLPQNNVQNPQEAELS